MRPQRPGSSMQRCRSRTPQPTWSWAAVASSAPSLWQRRAAEPSSSQTGAAAAPTRTGSGLSACRRPTRSSASPALRGPGVAGRWFAVRRRLNPPVHPGWTRTPRLAQSLAPSESLEAPPRPRKPQRTQRRRLGPTAPVRRAPLAPTPVAIPGRSAPRRRSSRRHLASCRNTGATTTEASILRWTAMMTVSLTRSARTTRARRAAECSAAT
mmetsp:Transcript_74956/g.236964  ORF Transcript_74956/g.236964 Transcript_74956/m.236964 type:complete len:211 (-) Transcript_74956:2445-3077(-)